MRERGARVMARMRNGKKWGGSGRRDEGKRARKIQKGTEDERST